MQEAKPTNIPPTCQLLHFCRILKRQTGAIRALTSRKQSEQLYVRDQTHPTRGALKDWSFCMSDLQAFCVYTMISNQGVGPLCRVKASNSPQALAHTLLYLDWQRERQSVILNGACGIRCDISVKHSVCTCPVVFVQMKHAEWLLVCVTARRPG